MITSKVLRYAVFWLEAVHNFGVAAEILRKNGEGEFLTALASVEKTPPQKTCSGTYENFHDSMRNSVVDSAQIMIRIGGLFSLHGLHDYAVVGMNSAIYEDHPQLVEITGDGWTITAHPAYDKKKLIAFVSGLAEDSLLEKFLAEFMLRLLLPPGIAFEVY